MQKGLRQFAKALNDAEEHIVGIRDAVNEHILKSGYHSFIPETLFYGLKHLHDTSIIQPGDNFFDFGCGPAKMLAMARYTGLSAYGIDVNGSLLSCASDVMRHAELHGKLDPRTQWKVAQGNYYPKQYVALRRAGLALAPDYEKEENPMGSYDETYQQTDPYSLLGKQLHEFNVLYAYCWASQVPGILETVAKYAKPDAVLMYASSDIHAAIDELQDKLGLFVVQPKLHLDNLLHFASRDKKIIERIGSA